MKKLAADIERQCGDIEILSFAVENLSADNWQPGAAVENLAGRREFLPVAARHAGVRRGFFGDDFEARSADMAARDEHMESASEYFEQERFTTIRRACDLKWRRVFSERRWVFSKERRERGSVRLAGEGDASGAGEFGDAKLAHEHEKLVDLRLIAGDLDG